MPITDDYPSSHLPHSVCSICADTWFISGSQVRKNNTLLKENYCVNLNRLSIGDRVGIRVTSDRVLKLFINGESAGSAAYNLPKVCLFFFNTKRQAIPVGLSGVTADDNLHCNTFQKDADMVT